MKKRTRKKYWNLIFKKVFNEAYLENISLLDICEKIKKYKNIIQRYKSYCQTYEADYRSGYETYGYNSLESIEGNLIYISDRFGCGFRLAWLINVPDEVNKLMNAANLENTKTPVKRDIDLFFKERGLDLCTNEHLASLWDETNEN